MKSDLNQIRGFSVLYRGSLGPRLLCPAGESKNLLPLRIDHIYVSPLKRSAKTELKEVGFLSLKSHNIRPQHLPAWDRCGIFRGQLFFSYCTAASSANAGNVLPMLFPEASPSWNLQANSQSQNSLFLVIFSASRNSGSPPG